jgi:hypothetical protein
MEQSTAEHTKVPVVVRDDYVMYLEFAYNLLWFHTDVHRWTSKVKVKYMEDLNLLHFLTGIPIVAMVKEDNKKLAKFGELLGWEKKQDTVLNSGELAYIYMWSK